MTRTKISTKILITLVIVLIAVCLLGANKVNATEITDEEIQAIINKIPDTIEIDKNVKTTFENIWSNGLNEEKSVLNSKVGTLPESLALVVINYKDTNTGICDMSKLSVILRSKSGEVKEYCNKTVTIKYADTNWNETDKNYVADKISKVKLKESIVYGEKDIETEMNDTYIEDVAIAEYSKLINDSSIKCDYIPCTGDGINGLGWNSTMGPLAFSKNGVVYYYLNSANVEIIPVVTIPSNIEDTEKAFVDYATPIIKNKIQSAFEDTITITSLKKDTSKENQYLLAFNLSGENFADNIPVILRKTSNNTETKAIEETDTTTNIKLDTTTDIVPAGTKLVANKVTEGETYNTVVEALGSKVSKFVLYDISLTSNNATIQPNGKVKISIPVPEGYDTSKIVVYRVAKDGTKTKYDTTINNGYVIFETDHFSNYVVAEETKTAETSTTTDETTNTSNTNKQLDNTPKTGEENYTTVIASIISIISALGLAILKKM